MLNEIRADRGDRPPGYANLILVREEVEHYSGDVDLKKKAVRPYGEMLNAEELRQLADWLDQF